MEKVSPFTVAVPFFQSLDGDEAAATAQAVMNQLGTAHFDAGCEIVMEVARPPSKVGEGGGRWGS